MLFQDMHIEYKTHAFLMKKKKPSPQLTFVLLIAAFKKCTKIFLFARHRGDSNLRKPLRNKPRKELAAKRRAL